MTQPQRLLFLDYDGVLHTTHATTTQRFNRADLLAQALGGIECDIVVSSSWRFHHQPAEMIGPLPAALRERVIGATGPAAFGRWPRYREIRAFLDVTGPDIPWRALDDAWTEFPPGCPELIACNPNVGLDVTQLQALVHWARGP